MLLWVFIRFYCNFQAQDKNSCTHPKKKKKKNFKIVHQNPKCKFILRRVYHKLLNYEILIRKRTNKSTSYSYMNTFFFKVNLLTNKNISNLVYHLIFMYVEVIYGT